MIASVPAAWTCSATDSIAAVSRPTRARRAPSAAKAMVIAAPMPLAGPVITATRPPSPRSIVVSSLAHKERSAGVRFVRRTGPRFCSEQLFRERVSRRQERRREDFIDRRRARKTVGIDQDVDGGLEPRHVDIAEADLRDLGMVHLILECCFEPLALDRNLDQRLALGHRGDRGVDVL